MGALDCSVVIQVASFRGSAMPSVSLIVHPVSTDVRSQKCYIAARVSQASKSNTHPETTTHKRTSDPQAPIFTSHPTQYKTSLPSPPEPRPHPHHDHLLPPHHHLPLPPPPSLQPTTPSSPPSPIFPHPPNPTTQSPHPTPARSPGNGYGTATDRLGTQGTDNRSGGPGRGSSRVHGDG